MKKIFLGTTEISGILSNLQKGFIEQGFDVIYLTKQKHKFLYSESNNLFQSIIHAITKLSSSINIKIFRKILILIREMILLLALPYYIVVCDTFIFLAGESILYHNLDLPILKFLKKNIIFEFLGTDSRPSFVNGAFENYNINSLINVNFKIKKRISFIERYATNIICWPSTSMFFNKKLINGFYIGLPVKVEKNIKKNALKKEIKILHCPSRLKGKGTYEFRKIINNLRENGYVFEYKELINTPNKVVKDELKSATFVLDQLYADVPLAGFASEAASFGVPAIVGGYYSKGKYNYFCESSYIPPSDYVEPEDIETILKKYLDDIDYVYKKGEELHQFICSHYDYKIVANNMKKIIDKNIPPNWFYDPMKVEYILGSGVSKKEIYNRIKEIIDNFNSDIFLLNDKPILKQKIMDIYNGKIL